MSPASCSISADFNGGNQNLDKAFTDLNLFLGPKQLAYTLKVVEVSDARIQYTISDINNGLTKRFRLKTVPTDILTGHVKFEFTTTYGETTGGTFQFTTIRDVNTLDWIKDWENNKTKIGSDYLITPQIFVGKKVTSESQMSVLTGVYIGPEGIAPNSSAGIYGYKEGKEIFHINETGGSIGGWDINNGGIQTADGCLQILSEGSIFAKDINNNIFWGIYKNGEAVFSKGNVKFSKDGSAYFKGKVTSSEGDIGGWKITKNLLYSNYIVLDSSKHYIGVSPFDMSTLSSVADTFKHYDKVVSSGGIAIHYTSANSYGIEGYMSGSKNTFKLGSTNFIAGWNFDNESFYIGTKNNTTKQYTSASGSITIGTGGVRGYGWYIDANGDISFMKGLITFNSTSGTLLGWKMSSQRLSNQYVALISEAALAGLYLSATDISNIASSSLETTIKSNSGIFLKRGSSRVELTGVNGGKTIFSLISSGDSTIAGWKFNNEAIYSGTLKSSGFTSAASNITISTSGIRGFKWRFDSNGAGAIAGGNISWDNNGVVTFASSVSLNWTNAANSALSSAKTYADEKKTEAINAAATDAANKVKVATDAANAAQAKANDANSVAIAARDRLNDWAKDSIISPTEKLALKQEQKGLADEKIQIVADAAKYSVSSTAYVTAYTNYNTQLTNHTAASPENITIAAAFTTTQTAYYAAKQTVLNAIAAAAKKYAEDKAAKAKEEAINAAATDATAKAEAAKELALAMAFGRMLYRDPTFINGNNSVDVYNNSNNGTVTITRTSDSSAPNDNKISLVVTNTGAASPYCGGFYFGTVTTACRVLIARIVANIPVGRAISHHSNSIGDGGSQKWLTPTAGTGNWEEYICKIVCGKSGTFSSTCFFALTGAVGTDSSPVKWKVAYATVFDVQSTERYMTTIDANGIYTGTVKAGQILVDSTLVVGGSKYNGSISVRDDSNVAKVTLDRTGITAVGGTIGGWTIDTNQISKNGITLGADGSITNGTKWKLNYNGSGQLANGGLSWDANGNLSLSSSNSGNRIMITPNSNGSTIRLVNSAGTIVSEWGFYAGGWARLSIDDKTRIDPGVVYVGRSTHLRDDELVVAADKNSSGGPVFAVHTYNSMLEVILQKLPTSASGLSPGSVWRDGNTLKIIP
ncbi:hypothetical protein D0T60_01575 [Bacteroides sp. 224]|nr:hypothetical protein [Bacteroides sp. 224]